MEKSGFDATYLSVNKEGLINIEELRRALRPETILVSVMYANNEIGTIQLIAKISNTIRNFRSTKHEARNTKQVLNSNDKNSKNFGFRI